MVSYPKAAVTRSKRTERFVQAIIDAEGSIKVASAELGVHVNTISRTLSLAGIRFQDLRRQARYALQPELFSDQTVRPNGLCTVQPDLGRKRPRSAGLPSGDSLFNVRNGTE